MITGTTKHITCHILWISILRFLYSNFLSASYCTIFLSDGKEVLSLLLAITSSLFARTSLSVYTISIHNTITSHFQLPTWVCGSTSFLLFQFFISCILSSADVYILYHVLLCIHSLPEWDILILGGQLSLHILYTVGIYFQFLASELFLFSSGIEN
jgi:hypothetical protein